MFRCDLDIEVRRKYMSVGNHLGGESTDSVPALFDWKCKSDWSLLASDQLFNEVSAFAGHCNIAVQQKEFENDEI